MVQFGRLVWREVIVLKDKMVKVSCILPSYNFSDWLPQAIESIITQTLSDWELLIIDDLSDDGALEIAQSYAREDSRIKVSLTDLKDRNLRKVNRYAHNINLAWPKSVGKYITYLGGDDWFLPRRFQIMSEYLDNDDSIYIVYSSQGVIRVEASGDEVFQMNRPLVGITWNAQCRIDQGSVMHRKECFDVVGGWDEDPNFWHCGEARFWVKLNKYWPFYPIDEVLDVKRLSNRTISWITWHGDQRYVPLAVVKGESVENTPFSH